MRGRGKLFHCMVCGKEILHSNFCTVCGRIAAELKKRKYTQNFTEAQLIKCVKRNTSWQRYRAGHAQGVGSKPCPVIPVEYEQPDTLEHAGNAILACEAAEKAIFSIISPPSGRRLEDNRVPALPKEAQHPHTNTPSGRAVYEKEGE